MSDIVHTRILERSLSGHLPDNAEALMLAECVDLPSLMSTAATLRDSGFGNQVTYSRKVFIPLTMLCRDTCHYCTFAKVPRKSGPAYLSPEQVLKIAQQGVAAGCHEALFTLGDKPELRYEAARSALQQLGCASTLEYLASMAKMVFEKTGLLPHLNPGVMSCSDLLMLRKVSVSQGIMLETASDRLSARGGPHFGSPDKAPQVRLATINAAGEAAIPFTTGILIGIGETRRERVEALLALRDLHRSHGHIQEIIIQNFRAKADTKMANAPEPTAEDHLWTIAFTRILFGAGMSIQAPPNLADLPLSDPISAGINDWGGVSPVTPDHVNPEAPWPEITRLSEVTRDAGKVLTPRLALYPGYFENLKKWVDPALHSATLRLADAGGLAREDKWVAGAGSPPPRAVTPIEIRHTNDDALRSILRRADAGETLDERDIVRLFSSRGREFDLVCASADALRARMSGNVVTYVVNRNINYTNVCYFKCQFCAFSKGKLSANLRGKPYDLTLDEIRRRTVEAWERGATEVCLQGGIHPDYTGATYIDICRTIKSSVPDMHIHAFSPLEVSQGAQTLGLSVSDFLTQLKDAGLGTLPGTAAEILDDEVRKIICPDKVTTDQWLEVIGSAHALGLRTTATIMFGHVEHYRHWARHLLRLRTLQQRTGGITEFVPLPFVPMETPIYLKGRSRSGPTYREAILMHAVARLVLHPHITNIQASWVKMGPAGVQACLQSGANDLGGTLMNESITRAAGATHGEEMPPDAMEQMIRTLDRSPLQRTTLYGAIDGDRRDISFKAKPLTAPVLNSARRFERSGSRAN